MTDPDLRVHFVWLPVLDGDHGPVARALSQRDHDGRTRHYWAPTRAIGEAWARVAPPLGSEPLAWDVVLLFDRRARWRPGELPRPALVRYPRGMSPEGQPSFDAAELRRAVLARTRSK